jgi:Insect cuticle protein
MRTNPDGSMTWGYENEDGTFKEETLGVDCVVKGKYGYVDPDGTKREYEYQQGNPCDPNKKDQPEDEEEDDPSAAQKLGGILTARPGQQQQRRPVQQIYQQQG